MNVNKFLYDHHIAAGSSQHFSILLAGEKPSGNDKHISI